MKDNTLETGKKDNPNGELATKTLWQVACRCLFLEASWNHDGQQNLGFAAAISPALDQIYKNRPDDLATARLRALSFFNTNPVVSSLVIGAAIKTEIELSRGETTPDRRRKILTTLAGAMASQGDQLYWQSWLPLSSLMAITLVYFNKGSIWAPLALPVIYGLLTWPVRFGGLFAGYRLGRELSTLIFRWKVPSLVLWLRRILAFITGLLCVLILGLASGHLSCPDLHHWLLLPILAVMFWLGQKASVTKPDIGPWLYPVNICLITGLFCLL